MTNQEIDEMEAGPALDALIAEKIMGWRNLEWHKANHDRRFCSPEGWYGEGPDDKCFLAEHYSTDIAAAWAAVEKFNIIVWPLGTGSYKALQGKVKAYANTAPLAICRAALKAVNAPDPFFERPGAVKGLAGCEEMEANA